MSPKNSRVHNRSVSALSNASNVSTQSTISIEFYDSADESAEMQSTNKASSPCRFNYVLMVYYSNLYSKMCHTSKIVVLSFLIGDRNRGILLLIIGEGTNH
ncbi:hypothetical protein OUZ56_018829 [Daphnia magna]|uniref:Uncharacterized protein n=1 Tax=Daphnia magna TaxID=35525 RepID=A0ABQ9Z9V9_9CRUS|nr:hypothetical protein OUZ56_018829 [Daphnia magna]